MSAPLELDRFAHDLRHFIREIVSESQLALQRGGGTLPPDTRASLERIAAAGAASDDLIRAMYEFETAAAKPHSRATLGGLLRAMEMEVRPSLGSAVLTVEADTAADVLVPVAVAHVVRELVRNAAKFGATEIRVRAGGDRGLHLEVSDNGIGIPPEYRRQIFEPYRRLHPRGEYSGHGLGLATADRYVRQLGGSIFVERSSAGGGSTFAVTLPLSPESA